MESSNQEYQKIYQQYVDKQEGVTEVLQHMQQIFGYVPEEAVCWFSEKSGVSVSTMYGVVTFYNKLYLEPRGKNILTACCGAVCRAKGADQVISGARKELGLKGEQVTSKDKLFTFESVNCVGACSLAPVVIVNDEVHAGVTPDQMSKKIETLRTEQ